MTQFDAATFQQKFAEALPAHAEQIHAEAQQKADEHGMPLAALDMSSITGAAANFCTQWPKIRGFINMAVSTLGWFQPAIAASVKAFLAAAEATIIPTVCGTDAPKK